MRKNKPVKKRQVAVFRASGKESLPGVRKLGLFGIFEAKEGEQEGYGNPIFNFSIGQKFL